MLGKATQVMEDAGYSESNQYSVTLTVFEDESAWQDVAKLVRDKASAAHIDLKVETAPFGTIISRAIDGSMDVFSLSDGLEWPEADNFLRFLHTSTSSSFTRWGQYKGGESKYTKRAESAWQDYLNHRSPSDANQKARDKDYLAIEECNGWESQSFRFDTASTSDTGTTTSTFACTADDQPAVKPRYHQQKLDDSTDCYGGRLR